MARLSRVICVWPGVALAIWLVPASVHIVDWTAAGPVRVALLPPLWKLGVAMAIAAGLAGALGLRDRSHRIGNRNPEAPLALLWLWVIPYLPWLPDWAPALLALAGPLRWGVLALAVSGFAALYWPTMPTWPIGTPGRRTAFAVSLTVYLSFGLWSASAVGPGADEPHYLVITQSLLRDHDLAIENNHARGDYREYFGGDLRPDFLRRGLNDVIYSIHAPGLPALILPVYAVAGYRGTVVMECLLGALAALAVFDLAMLLAGTAAAWATWAAVCLTVPFVPHSWLIFPEMPGALIMAWAALWLYAPLPTHPGRWVWRGTALALLPWLHTKFVILLAAMLAALLLRVWRNPRAAAALVTPGIVSVGLWLYSFYALYGVFDPQIPYGDFPKLYVLFSNIPRGLLGLLFDQKFGLIMYAPVYVVAGAGGWSMLRRDELKWFAAALLATVAAFVASSTRMYMWWGGSSAPARFLVPVLPLVAPMIATAFHERRPATDRALFALFLVVSLAVAAVGVTSPQRFMLFSAPHGLANLVAAVQGPSPLFYLLPTFTEEGTRAPVVLLAAWGSAAILATAAALAVAHWRNSDAGLATVSVGLSVFAVGGAILAGAPTLAAQRRATVLRGRLDLMRAYDGPALRGFSYARMSSIGAGDLFAQSAVHLSRVAGELVDGRQFAGPVDLPAGHFTVKTALAGAAAGDTAASVSILVGRGALIASGPAANAAPIAFDVPVDAAVQLEASDDSVASAIRDVDITADSIVPRRERPDIDSRAIEPIAGHPGALLIYSDDKTYPEGGIFWTQGTRSGRVFVAPAGAATIVLTLYAGPVGGVVHLAVGDQPHDVTLTRDQTQRIEVPLAPSARLVPIVVGASGSFRPSDHDPGSGDRRWLGCQVRVELR